MPVTHEYSSQVPKPPAPKSPGNPGGPSHPGNPSNSSNPGRPGRIDPRSLSLGLSAYLIWGFFPLYFHALSPAGSLEVIVHRAVWGLAACIVAIAIFARWNLLKRVLRDNQAMQRLPIAGLLIMVNWTVYVYAVQSGHTVDAALGYFINPLVTVGLAWIVLKEKLTPAQMAALALGVIAVVILIIGVGRLPWVSLVLAFTFGFYALVKKEVAPRVPPLEGMAVETATVTPVVLGYYIYLTVNQSTSFHTLAQTQPATHAWVGHLALLIGAGILTMIPLLLFARAAKGLPLAVLGLIQYIAPIMQMFVGVVIFKETMEPARWVATGIIWLALLLLSADWIRQIVRARH